MQSPIKVFVHLAYGYGARQWAQRWKDGKIIGINEPLPYGYFRAAQFGCSVDHSQDKDESAPEKILRLGVRAILGFDVIHAWRNFKQMMEADVIWTHTESQYLAILLLFRLTRRERRPKLIAQSVWLIDRWSQFSHLKRRLFAWLIQQADILTFLSPENLAIARNLFPAVRSELVLFGINADHKTIPALRSPHPVLRIASLGNDEHRDWPVLIETVSKRTDWALKIASSQVPAASLRHSSNVEIVRPKSNEELLDLYGWADLLVIALRPNAHGSGITVIQEAILRGVPVICSDVGGLRAYFSDDEIRFVKAQDSNALEQDISKAGADPEGRLAMATRAQARMGPAGLSSESYVRRHVEISRDLLNAVT